MLKRIAPLVLTLAMACAAGPVLAAGDLPTPHQVYEAARSGHMAEAEQMINQVLRAEPNNARAHFIAAEIYAHEHNIPRARQELSTAESLAPGLPFERNPQAVRELQMQLAQGSGSPGFRVVPAASHSSFPWGWVLIVVGGIAVLWLIFRPRPQPVAYGSYPAVGGPAGGPVIGGGPVMGGPVMGGGGPIMGPGYGTGGGMLGALGTGLAVGAGVAVGEELVHRVLDGGGRETVVVPREAPGEYVDPNINSDMGGNDFGLSDGNSWGDDNSGGSFGGGDFGGGGGDDWT